MTEKTIEQVMETKPEGFTKKWKDIIIPFKPTKKWPVVSTGLPMLDINLGVGGYPLGRIVEIYGQEGTGKTTLALMGILEAQRIGMPCAFIDMEHALDTYYAKRLGIDVETLLFAEPDYGEQALDFVSDCLESGYKFIVFDSIASAVPKAEIEGSVLDNKLGLHARIMSQGLRMLVHNVARQNAVVIFINQLREKIGVMYGNPEVTTGGNSLKFYASIRLDVRRSAEKKQGDKVTGSTSTIRIKKNKLCDKGLPTEIEMIDGQGFDMIGSIIDYAVANGIIIQSGSWYSYKDSKLGQGKDKVVQLLKDNQELLNKIK